MHPINGTNLHALDTGPQTTPTILQGVGKPNGRLAYPEGREILPLQLDRRVERLDEELRGFGRASGQDRGPGGGVVKSKTPPANPDGHTGGQISGQTDGQP